MVIKDYYWTDILVNRLELLMNNNITGIWKKENKGYQSINENTLLGQQIGMPHMSFVVPRKLVPFGCAKMCCRRHFGSYDVHLIARKDKKDNAFCRRVPGHCCGNNFASDSGDGVRRNQSTCRQKLRRVVVGRWFMVRVACNRVCIELKEKNWCRINWVRECCSKVVLKMVLDR